LLTAACGSDEAAMGLARAAADAAPETNNGSPVADDEEEAGNEKFLSVAPAFSEDFIFVANPSIDSITKIAVGKGHMKELIPVGLYPSLVKSVGGRVLVLNSGDHSITFVTAATSKTFTVPIPKEINDVVFNTTGYGIAFVNTAKLPKEIVGGSQSTDVFSILDIDAGLVVTKGISFAPKHIVFTRSNPPLALLAADAKGALVNLLAPTAKPTALNFSASLTANELEEAAITPDGARAFFRESGQLGVRVLEIGTNALASVAADAVPTDMDLSPDGGVLFVSDSVSGYRMRRFNATLPAVSQVGSDVTSSMPYRQSEFTPDGTKAVLFTTSADEAAVGIYDVAAGTIRDVDVQLPVDAALMAPDSATAVLVHRSPAGKFYPQKVTLLNLATGEEPDIDLEGDLDKIDFSADGDWAYLTTKTPNYFLAISLRTNLHKAHELNNTPIFMSAVPGAGGAGKAFVSQSHENGQITFLDVTQTLSDVSVVPDEVIGFLLGTTAE
jgi:DNA-binding beta-propeller fold protein YncE